MSYEFRNSVKIPNIHTHKYIHVYIRTLPPFTFQSPCCGKVYPCRLCHNDQELSHEIDRQSVSEVECRRCHTRQPVSLSLPTVKRSSQPPSKFRISESGAIIHLVSM